MGLRRGDSGRGMPRLLLASGAVVALAVGIAAPAHAAPKVPGQPTGVVATAGSAKATVSWKAPKSNGGKKITGYIVTSKPGGKTCSTKALKCTVTGLTSGTSYTFTVRAKNAIGFSKPSKPSKPVIPPLPPVTVPGAPTAAIAGAGSNEATVSWSAPASNGGSAVTGYTVTSAPGAKTCSTNGGLVCTVTGLTNGTSYSFTVKAKNKAGFGAASTPSNPVIPNPPVRLAAGYFHNCAVVAGAVKCWGSNVMGQLGDGTKTNSSTPVTVPGITNALAVGTGGSHSCALLLSRLIECWGNGQQGQLGNGGVEQSSVPVGVVGVSQATALAVGDNHACALLFGGSVKCWGGGWYGQLGNGATANQSTPVVVDLGAQATSISARGDHTCATVAGGGVRCWGSNSFGEMGIGANSEGEALPQAVIGLTAAAVGVAAGDHHTCAALVGGTAMCWGQNSAGQLGNGQFVMNYSPTSVTGLNTVVGVAAGLDQSCAWLTNGTVDCWGGNSAGQLGRGDSAGVQDSADAAPVVGVNTAVLVAAGRYYNCAALDGGAVQCWGANLDGVLGNPSPYGSNVPVTVGGL